MINFLLHFTKKIILITSVIFFTLSLNVSAFEIEISNIKVWINNPISSDISKTKDFHVDEHQHKDIKHSHEHDDTHHSHDHTHEYHTTIHESIYRNNSTKSNITKYLIFKGEYIFENNHVPIK
jgi:hypothetical protein